MMKVYGLRGYQHGRPLFLESLSRILCDDLFYRENPHYAMSQFSPFQMLERSDCRICGSRDMLRVLDLGCQPPSNSFIVAEDIVREQRFPLEVYLCRSCGLSQLRHVVAGEDIFDDYVYLSSSSGSLCRHYQGLVDAALALFRPPAGALAVDIGCNDGIMLRRFPCGRYHLLGIEPSSAGEYAVKDGLEVVPEFFTAALGERLARSHGRAHLITATNVFAHVDDIASFATGVYNLLAADGVWIIEFPYLVDMVDHCYFDTIYHEHLCYLALTPLTVLFGKVGLKAFRVERVEVGASGPGLRLFAARADAPRVIEASIAEMLLSEESWGIKSPVRYLEFAARVAGVRNEIRTMVASLRSKGCKVGAFGAPAKGNTLLNYLQLGPGEIAAAAENNELKIGKLMPGSHIPIINDEDFLAAGFSHALLLTWNYAEFFLKNSEFIKRGGKFIVPLPHPVIKP